MQRENVIAPSAIDPLLSDREVASITGRARSTLQKDRKQGGGLPYIRLGKQVRYRRSDVERWLESRQSFTSTSEYGILAPPRKS